MDLREIGKLLREERLRQGVELPAAAKVTKIGTSALEAIEEGDETPLPNPVYIKGFIRNYARFLKLDQSVVDNALGEVRFVSGNAMWSPPQSLPVARRSPLGWKIGLTALALIVLAGGGIALLQFSSNNGSVQVSDTPPVSPDSPSQPPELQAVQPTWPSTSKPHQEQAENVAAPHEAFTEAPASPTVAQEQAAVQEQAQDSDEAPTVHPDMNLQMVELDNMRLTRRPGNLRADFDIRNLSNDLISGSISISFISKDDHTFPALGNEEIPRFSIRNFRPVSTRLHLPPELNLDDVSRVQFVVTGSDGTDVLVKTYPIDRN
ncbi:helix-turn-helix domain-containing protein [Desulfonatronum thiodismutans]|uniref:helix-turn-helix domain-containing protein n=1 Tax=Desulfonatronum thiodismutans TaxID=159290 RepID=UPI0004ABD6EC|nr:helix-turn-helix domain-containing protein [Desulfonatronum thiodismutans]